MGSPKPGFGSPHLPKENEDGKGCTENPPSCSTGQSYSQQNSPWKSVEIFPACFFGSYYFSFFIIKAHLEATNALQVCKGWALNISQRVLPGVPPRELLALPPPWTQRHPGEQQPQPGLGGVVGFKYLQRKKEKKTRGKNSKQQTK